jgi:hypothetical protein
MAPGLWCIGYRTAIEGNLHLHPIEAGRIARAIAAARSRAALDRDARSEPFGSSTRTTQREVA